MKPDATPRVGAYWFSEDMSERVYFCGMNSSGGLLFEDDRHSVYPANLCDWSGWHHIPECTSFEWQPEKWPKYYETEDRSRFAFVRVGKGRDPVLVHFDGTTTDLCAEYDWVQKTRLELTESEALARIAKPVEPVKTCTVCGGPADLTDDSCKACHEFAMAKIAQPAEDPDEWVLITDLEHVIRPCDQISDYGTQWYPPSDLTGALGKSKKDCRFNLVRCRRRDLPPLPEKPATRTVTLYEWIRWDDANPNDISI